MSFDATISAAGDLIETDPLEQWLDDATSKLQIDPELRLEIRQEFKSHYDEAVSEFLRAGRSASDAGDEAIQSLGNPKLLGEQLLRANRHRIKLRAALVWSARLILPVIAAGLIIALSISAITSSALVSGLGVVGFAGNRDIAENYRERAIAGAPADIRALFDQEIAPDRKEVARKLWEKHPDDLALYANYAQAVTMRDFFRTSINDKDYDAALTDNSLNVMAQGEKLDPCNAYYPLMTANILFNRGTVFENQDSDPKAGWTPSKIQIVSQADVNAALAAMHRAASKPMFNTYGEDLLMRKLSVIPVDRLTDICLRLEYEISTLLPHLNCIRHAAVTSSSYAAAYATDHDAQQIVQDIHAIARKLAGNSKIVVELLVASGIEDLANESEKYIALKGHDVATAQAADKRLQENKKLVASSRTDFRGTPEERAREGVLFGKVIHQLLPDPNTVAPMRQAEYDVTDQLAIAVIAFCVMGVGLLYAVRVLLGRWAPGERDNQTRLMIPARQLVAIILLGVAAPILVYAIYARATSLGGREYGLNHTGLRVVIEYVLLLIAVLGLTSTLAQRAIRRRAVELGITLPKLKIEFVNASAVAAGILALVCLAVAVASVTSGVLDFLPRSQQQPAQVGLVIAAWVLLSYIPVCIFRNKKRGTEARPPHTLVLARSMFVPMIVGAVLAALLGLPLRSMEKHDVRQVVSGNQPLLVYKEVESTSFNALREHVLEREGSAQSEVSSPMPSPALH